MKLTRKYQKVGGNYEFYRWNCTFWVWRLEQKEIGETLASVYVSLGEKGYNPINQMVGYVLSGDPAYIPRHNDARNKIRRFDRDDIVEELIKNYLRDQGIDLWCNA